MVFRFLVTILGLGVIGVLSGLMFGVLQIDDGPSLRPGPRLTAASAEAADRAQPPPLADVDQLKPVKLFTIGAPERDLEIILPATIDAAQETELSFDIGGRLIELNVDGSDVVAQGDVIARIDAEDLQNNVAEARAEFSRADSEYQRALRLAARDAISVSEVETRRTSRDVAAAALATAEKLLDDATLRAPFSGFIADVQAEQFQTVGANQTIAILQTSGVAATVDLPADLIIFRPQYEPAETIVTLDALPGQEFPAEFLEAAGIADPATQTYEVSFLFTPSDDLLVLPGMTASVRTSLQLVGEGNRVIPGGVRAPVSSVVSVGGDLFVWVYDAGTTTISRRDIVVGEGVGSTVNVVEGLEEGDTIVAAGGASLSDGMSVRPWMQE
ncbi:MAG: efflux RND transporter periplasmic adaptor subunit [Pseudomonadota bacterium]